MEATKNDNYLECISEKEKCWMSKCFFAKTKVRILLDGVHKKRYIVRFLVDSGGFWQILEVSGGIWMLLEQGCQTCAGLQAGFRLSQAQVGTFFLEKPSNFWDCCRLYVWHPCSRGTFNSILKLISMLHNEWNIFLFSPKR